MRQHASEDGKRRRRLLVELAECRALQFLQVIAQMERRRLRGRHFVRDGVGGEGQDSFYRVIGVGGNEATPLAV